MVSLWHCDGVDVRTGALAAHRLEVEVGVSSQCRGDGGVRIDVNSHRFDVEVSSSISLAGSAHRSDRKCGCGGGSGVAGGLAAARFIFRFRNNWWIWLEQPVVVLVLVSGVVVVALGVVGGGGREGVGAGGRIVAVRFRRCRNIW